MRALKLLGIACGLLSCASFAQAEFLAPKSESIKSQLLHQDRAIEVYLPEESTKQPADRYETLYVLDGDWNAKLVIEVVNFMHGLGLLPPIIVVSVPNYIDAHGVNSRDRDLTPSASEEQARSGGASEFAAFLRNELLPFVDQHYPANGLHLVHGHSYGGLFLMYVLANDPHLFDGYLVLDPAMWWEHGAFKASLRDRLAAIQGQGKAVYLAGRAGGGAKDMGLDDLEPILQAGMPASLHWQMKLYEDETHDSLKLKATYDALKFAYGGYAKEAPEVAPADGILLKYHPVRLLIPGRRGGFVRYTTDGSEPTDKSALGGDGFVVSDPGKTRVRLVSTRGVFDRDILLNLRFGSPLPPARSLTLDASGDWRYALYPADAWSRLAANRPAKTVKKGTTARDLSFRDLGLERVAGRVERQLVIPSDGYFVFVVHANQSRLRIGDTTLISNDGPDDQRFRTFLAPLERGIYSLLVDFVTATKTPSLWVAVYRADERTQWGEQPEWAVLRGK